MLRWNPWLLGGLRLDKRKARGWKFEELLQVFKCFCRLVISPPNICISPNNHAYLVPIPCPLVPISAIRDWKPSGLNHYKIDNQCKCPLTQVANGQNQVPYLSDYMNFVSSGGRVFFLQTGVHLERRCKWVVTYFWSRLGNGMLAMDLTISCAVYTSCFNQSRCRGSQSHDPGKPLSNGTFQPLMTKNISLKTFGDV